jgi:hypothetical protein
MKVVDTDGNVLAMVYRNGRMGPNGQRVQLDMGRNAEVIASALNTARGK